MNKAAGERLMWRVFDRQRKDFIQPKRDEAGAIIPPPDVLVYVEEAHNLLPAKADDLTTIWSRIAKEEISGLGSPMQLRSRVRYKQTF